MVEDDPDIQIVARMALEVVGGYTVSVCSNGQQALDEVADFGPDLILLDVMMPDMDGPTVLRHLKENPATAHFPVVFMTAKAQSHEIAAYRAMGALDVISKPFDAMLLSAKLAELWERHRLQTSP